MLKAILAAIVSLAVLLPNVAFADSTKTNRDQMDQAKKRSGR